MAKKSESGAVVMAADSNQTGAPAFLSNAEIADRLASLAQLLSSQKENPYKIKAYQRAAAKLRTSRKVYKNWSRTKPI